VFGPPRKFIIILPSLLLTLSSHLNILIKIQTTHDLLSVLLLLLLLLLLVLLVLFYYFVFTMGNVDFLKETRIKAHQLKTTLYGLKLARLKNIYIF